MSSRGTPPLRLSFGLFTVAAVALEVSCVPTGSAPPYDAGPAPSAAATYKPSTNIMTAPFEDTFDRPDSGDTVAAVDAAVLPSDTTGATGQARGAGEAGTPAAGDGGRASSEDAGAMSPGERPSNVGPNWTTSRPSAWRIENGRLCGQNAKNHGIWLNRTLPINARIEFDAIALTETGDAKAEVWGDGHSFATSTSYTNATSYLAILGGWQNTIHALARLNEHGKDRKEIAVDKESDDPRERAVVRGQLYQFKIERTDGKTVRMAVNGVEYFSWTDAAPLVGQGHDHMGFNNWEVKVCYDNVKVTPL